MSKELKLKAPKEVVIKKQETRKVSSIFIREVKDNYTSVTAMVSFDDLDLTVREIVLWEGKDYEEIGQWTDKDIQKRILEII